MAGIQVKLFGNCSGKFREKVISKCTKNVRVMSREGLYWYMVYLTARLLSSKKNVFFAPPDQLDYVLDCSGGCTGGSSV